LERNLSPARQVGVSVAQMGNLAWVSRVTRETHARLGRAVA
jgi:hypothetical protein